MLPLSGRDLHLLRVARRAVLVTSASDGTPRPVPIAFVTVEPAPAQIVLYSPLDEKRKSVADPRHLARVRDIAQRPRVSVLVDEWSEDWSSLGWLRLIGTASLIEPAHSAALRAEHERAVGLLRAKYAQYATHRLEAAPIIRIAIERATSWYATA